MLVRQAVNMSKYFTYIYIALLLVAGGLFVTATSEMKTKIQAIEGRVGEINMMLKDMTDE